MKLTFIILLLAVCVGTVLSATSCLPTLTQDSTCEDPPTYRLCQSNALSKFCNDSDLYCNCMQAREFVLCAGYCQQDANVTAALNTCQMAEKEKNCKDVPLESQTYAATTPNPTSTSNNNNNNSQDSIWNSGNRVWLATEYITLVSSGVALLLL